MLYISHCWLPKQTKICHRKCLKSNLIEISNFVIHNDIPQKLLQTCETRILLEKYYIWQITDYNTMCNSVSNFVRVETNQKLPKKINTFFFLI